MTDLISRCNPTEGTVDPTFGLSSAAICNQSSTYILEDGFRSFPSGHSSRECRSHVQNTRSYLGDGQVSFAGLGFLSFYLAGKMHLFDRRGHAVRHFRSIRVSAIFVNKGLRINIGESMDRIDAIGGRLSRGHLPYDGLSP